MLVSACREEERILNHQELELQLALAPYVGARNGTQVLCKSNEYFQPPLKIH